MRKPGCITTGSGITIRLWEGLFLKIRLDWAEELMFFYMEEMHYPGQIHLALQDQPLTRLENRFLWTLMVYLIEHSLNPSRERENIAGVAPVVLLHNKPLLFKDNHV